MPEENVNKQKASKGAKKTEVDVTKNDVLDKDTSTKEIDMTRKVVNQLKTSELSADASDSSQGVQGSGMAVRGNFGGSDRSAGPDRSAVTRGERPYRSGGRQGRSFDKQTRDIDFNIHQPVKIIKREPKFIDEGGEYGQIGHAADDHILAQKSSGVSPADENFSRSINKIGVDVGFFTEGQYVTENIADEDEFLFRNHVPQDGNSSLLALQSYEDARITTQLTKGNYMPTDLYLIPFPNASSATELHIRWGAMEDVTPRGVDRLTASASGDYNIRSMNQIELDRLRMVDVAGDETSKDWSHLGDGGVDRTALNSILRTLDGATGDTVFMALRSLKQAHAYQVNKSHLDGLRQVGPMKEACNSVIEGPLSTAHMSSDEDLSCLEHPDALYNGSAWWGILLHDSTGKYRTKGKVLNLPQSIRAAIKVAEENAGPLYMNEHLYDQVKRRTVFSTLDGDYDPMKPVLMTDNYKLIYPMDWCHNRGFYDWVCQYQYSDLRSKYVVSVYSPLQRGVERYIKVKTPEILRALKRSERDHGTPTSVTTYNNPNNEDDLCNGMDCIRIPMVHSSASFSLWDIIVCYSVPFIVEDRMDSLKDLIKFEKNHGYPYSGMMNGIPDKCNDSDNFTFTDIDSALKIGRISDEMAIHFIAPEFMPIIRFNRNNVFIGYDYNWVQAMLPWYFTQDQFKYLESTDEIVLSDNPYKFSFPMERSGITLGSLDVLYQMGEERVLKALDRMVTYPNGQNGYEWVGAERVCVPAVNKLWHNNANMPNGGKWARRPCVYKVGQTSDGVPVLNYNVHADSPARRFNSLTIRDVISTPREHGDFLILPMGIATPSFVYGASADSNATGDNALNFVFNDEYDTPNYRNVDSSYFAYSGPSYKMYTWTANRSQPGAAREFTINIDRAATLQQVYRVIPCNESVVNFWDGYSLNANAQTAGDLFEHSIWQAANLEYDYDIGDYTGIDVPINTARCSNFHPHYWARLQLLPFWISPFDCHTTPLYIQSGGSSVVTDFPDIFDFPYLFGFCGFRMVDYEQAGSRRERDRIRMGMNYVEDTL